MKAKYFANLPWEENPTSAQKQSGEPLIDSTTQGGTDWICKALPDLERLPRLHQESAPAEERDEVNAICEALPDLERLVRYERRAWSRRKRTS